MEDPASSMLSRIKTAKSLKSAKSDRSSRPKSNSKSPDKKGVSSAKTVVSSAKTAKSLPKSAKSGSKSKSPRRKSSSKSDFNSSSFNEVIIKSTPDYEDMSNQGMTVISTKLFTKTTLKKLILSGNNLRSLPPAIADLVNLEYIDLSRNPLKVKDIDDPNCLPYEMRTMTKLNYLSISECNLRFLPATLWLFNSLTMLDLSRNKLGLLVPDIGNLSNLKYLYLSQCHLTTLPTEIAFCSELIEIVLMANQIESLPDTLKECKKLQFLRMSFRSFSTLLDQYMENLISKGQIKSEHIPVVVFDLENMNLLDLKHTKINNLPENNLNNLQDLYLDYNYFDNFSESNFNRMSISLKCLTVSHNLLKEIPNEINLLVNLEILDLSFNSIAALPNEFKINNIKELYLNNNNLHHLNSSLSQFKSSLIKLDFEKNFLSDLNESLFELTNLEYLNLSHNNLKKISASICKLNNLKLAHSFEKLNKIGLWVIGNPLFVPPKEVWQTQNIDKIYDYLSMYNQRNLQYVFYSKLIFIGESGVGKSRLVDAFFNQRTNLIENNEKNNVNDFKTIVARKFYKRTSNRIEWMILDVGGEPVYRQLHSLLFSSIDIDQEPTIFIIVYNHDEYKIENHDRLIGSHVESILIHTQTNIDQNNVKQKLTKIKLKLIGVCKNENETVVDRIDLSSKKEDIFEMTKKTIQSFNHRLLNEKEKNLIILNSAKDGNLSEENINYLREANQRIDNLVRKTIEIDSDLIIIDSLFRKNHVDKVMSSLENMTLEFKKVVPLDLKFNLKNLFTKMKKNRIDFDDLVNQIKESTINENFILNKPEYHLNINALINYAKTIGDLFWHKYNKALNKDVYLHFNYLLNCLKTFIRHDIMKKFHGDKSLSIKKIGIFNNDLELIESVNKTKEYGIIESKLVKGITFGSDHLNSNQVDDNLNILKDFSLLYESESNFMDEVCSYYQIVVPTLCASSYFAERKIIENSSILDNALTKFDNLIFTDNYERYFLTLDYLRCLKDYYKVQNSLTKKMIVWNLRDENHYEKDYVEEYGNDYNSKSKNFEIVNVKQIFLDSKFLDLESVLSQLDQTNGKTNQLKSAIEKLESTNETHFKAIIECCSPFKFEKNLFAKLSILIQDISYERFDWCDTIIGRNLDDTSFRIQKMIDPEDNNLNKIIFEFKSLDMDNLNKFKDQLSNQIDFLFSFYPGFYFYKEFKLC